MFLKPHDGISGQMLKNTAASITSSITMLFNQSLSLGVLPADWKESYIEPNPKVPSQAVPNNYFRPISFFKYS